MNSSTRRRLALPALVLAASLTLAACGTGSSNDTAGTGSSSSHEGGEDHMSDDSTGETATGNDADVAFLTGMKPHHEQAVEMSELVLAADPPAEVAAVAQRVKDAQSPEIEQMAQMLTDLGEEVDGMAHSGGHSDGMAGHGGMMSDGDMETLMSATGQDAARRYLDGMIEHHQGAIEASDTQIADGQYEPAVDLAKMIKAAQEAELVEMRALLESL